MAHAFDLVQAGSMDKFMRKIRPSAALKGAHLKDVRRHFKPTDLSYDNVAVRQIHEQRLLLKAEPQVGKTGMSVQVYEPCSKFDSSSYLQHIGTCCAIGAPPT